MQMCFESTRPDTDTIYWSLGSNQLLLICRQPYARYPVRYMCVCNACMSVDYDRPHSGGMQLISHIETDELMNGFDGAWQ